MDNLQDILRLADQFKYFHNAEQTAISTILGVHDALYVFLSPDMLLAASLVALSYFMLRLQYQRAFLWFFYLIFVMVMTYPVQIDYPNDQGSTRVSFALWHFNKLTTELIKLGERAVDFGLGRGGKDAGNFAAPTAALTVIAKNYAPEDTQLAYVYKDYLNKCTTAITNAKDKTVGAKLMEVFYTDRGKLGRDWTAWGGRKNTSSPTHNNLSELPVELKTLLEQISITKPIDGYVIESYDAMKRYYGGDKTNLELLRNPSPDTLGYYRKGEAPADSAEAEQMSLKYYPGNCYEMFQVVDLGWRQALRAAENNADGIVAVLAKDIGTKGIYSGIASSTMRGLRQAGHVVNDAVEDATGTQACVNSLPKLSAVFNAHFHHKNASTDGQSGYAGPIANSIASKIVEWIEEWGVSIAALFVPAAAALAMAGVFIIFPIVLGFSLIPGRESSVGTLVLTIIFIKLSVFFSYAILSAGGYITTSAICSMAYTREYVDGATTLTSSYRGIAAAGLVLTYLGAIGGGIWLAKVFTFNDRGSVAAMGLNKFGAKQLFQAASAAVAVVGGTRALGGVVMGGSKLIAGAQKSVPRISGTPPSQSPASQHDGRTTHADVRRRLDQMKIPK